MFSKCAYSASLFMCLWCAPVRDTSCIIALAHLIADDFHFLFQVKFVCVLMAKALLAAHNLLFQFLFSSFYFANFPFAHLFLYICLVVCLFAYFFLDCQGNGCERVSVIVLAKIERERDRNAQTHLSIC